MTPKPTSVQPKRLNMHIPPDLHEAFKAATAAEGKLMTDVLMEFIRKYVQQRRPDRQRGGGARK